MARSSVLKLDARWAPAVYFILGQAGWFACVTGAARGMASAGVVLVVVLIVLHLLRVERPVQELKLIITVAVLGGLWESAVLRFGLLAYPHGSLAEGVAPLWLVALWALFAAQVNSTYRWLKHRMLACALLGAVAGPLSFRAGAALDALQFVKVVPAAVTLAIGWAVILPLVVLLSRRWDGVDAQTQPVPIPAAGSE